MSTLVELATMTIDLSNVLEVQDEAPEQFRLCLGRRMLPICLNCEAPMLSRSENGLTLTMKRALKLSSME